jgi:hypothetical protein
MLDNQALIVVFVFIILVFVAIHLVKYNENKILIIGVISVATFALFGFLFGINPVMPEMLSENFQEGTDMVDTPFSKYGNMSLTVDADQAQQRILGMGEDLGPENPTSIDNSDVVQAVMLRGSSYFQPNWKGITPTSSGQYTNFSLAEPAEKGRVSPYDMTLSGGQNLDEILARKQQQRQYTAKQAIDGHVRATRNMFNKYFNNELIENEQKEWWSAEAQDFETDFRPWT